MDRKQLQATITTLLDETPDVLFAYLFGSRAKGTSHSQSDIDIAVYFAGIEDGPTGDIRVGERQLSLGLLLERALRKPVDLVALNRASVDMRQNVLLHGILLCCKDSRAHAQFKLAQLRHFQDFIMMEPIFRRYRRKRIEGGTFGGRALDSSQTVGHD